MAVSCSNRTPKKVESNVDLKVNGDTAYAFVAEPDDNARHPGIVLIQEWWGIEPHIRQLAQRLAAAGFVVAVPDLYHGKIATEPDGLLRWRLYGLLCGISLS
jgi:carboxymethylenebutenolidase